MRMTPELFNRILNKIEALSGDRVVVVGRSVTYQRLAYVFHTRLDSRACWNWAGAMSKKRAGYRPHMRVRGQYINPFRLLLALKDGVPLSRRRRLHAAHDPICGGNVRCVNPFHGHWATHAENNSERAPESFLRKDKRMTPGHTEFVAGAAAPVANLRDPENHVEQPAAPSTSAQADGDDGGDRIAGATTAPAAAPDPLIPSLDQYIASGYAGATYQRFVNQRVRELAANGVEPYTIQDALAAAGAVFIPEETQGTDEPGVMGAGLESGAPAAPPPPTAPGPTGPGPFTPPGEGE